MLMIFIIGFLLNLIWENAQGPLYKGFTNFWDHFWICFLASIVDAVIILLLYGLFAAWYKNINWVQHLNWQSAALLILLGGAMAVGFEQWALATEQWDYADSMPVVPFLNTGLSPLLQFMLLPLLTYLLSYKLKKI